MIKEYTFDHIVTAWDFINNTDYVWVERLKLNADNIYKAIQDFVIFNLKSDLRQGVECYVDYVFRDNWTLDEYKLKFGKEALNRLRKTIDLRENNEIIFSEDI
jgi:hypothetical protein